MWITLALVGGIVLGGTIVAGVVAWRFWDGYRNNTR